MIPLTVEEIADCTGGIVISGSPYIKTDAVSIDSAGVREGSLFIPLKGDTDGHAYIGDALRKGASGFLIEKSAERKEEIIKLKGSQFVIEVEDCLKALQDIAVFYRTKLKAKVIGITGSTGKTTTKDMLNCILSQKLRVICTDRNNGNEIGVPMTILQANHETEAMIIDMDIKGVGHVEKLAEIARPDLGVLTNIGQAHLELLGSEEVIARTKAELVEAIPEHGVAVLNADDLWTPTIVTKAGSRVVTYGIAGGNIRGTEIVVDDLGRASFRLDIGRGITYIVRLAVPGRHNVYNALAASAVATEMGFNADDIRISLANCRPSAMRMEIFTTGDNVVILNDAYDANPTSMQAALSTLMDVATEGRHIAVLGDMLELGKISNEAHKQIGEITASLGINILVAVGMESQVTAESAVKAGMKPKTVITCIDAATAAQVLKQLIKTGDVVLFKASREVGLETVIRALART